VRLERFRVGQVDDESVRVGVQFDTGDEIVEVVLSLDDAAMLALDLAGVVSEIDRRRVAAWAELN
jgi:hypothetical protein